MRPLARSVSPPVGSLVALSTTIFHMAAMKSEIKLASIARWKKNIMWVSVKMWFLICAALREH